MTSPVFTVESSWRGSSNRVSERREIADERCVGAVVRQLAELRCILVIAVQSQRFGDRNLFLECAKGCGLIDRVLGHLAIRGPFPTRDRQQSGSRNVDRVVSRDRGRVVLGAHADERPDARERAEDVVFGRIFGEVACRVLEEKIDLVIERVRLERDFVDRRVGGSNDDALVPRNREQHPAVVRMRHHDCTVAG